MVLRTNTIPAFSIPFSRTIFRRHLFTLPTLYNCSRELLERTRAGSTCICFHCHPLETSFNPIWSATVPELCWKQADSGTPISFPVPILWKPPVTALSFTTDLELWWKETQRLEASFNRSKLYDWSRALLERNTVWNTPFFRRQPLETSFSRPKFTTDPERYWKETQCLEYPVGVAWKTSWSVWLVESANLYLLETSGTVTAGSYAALRCLLS